MHRLVDRRGSLHGDDRLRDLLGFRFCLRFGNGFRLRLSRLRLKLLDWLRLRLDWLWLRVWLRYNLLGDLNRLRRRSGVTRRNKCIRRDFTHKVVLNVNAFAPPASQYKCLCQTCEFGLRSWLLSSEQSHKNAVLSHSLCRNGCHMSLALLVAFQELLFDFRIAHSRLRTTSVRSVGTIEILQSGWIFRKFLKVRLQKSNRDFTCLSHVCDARAVMEN
jgi:hypothetical protein